MAGPPVPATGVELRPLPHGRAFSRLGVEAGSPGGGQPEYRRVLLNAEEPPEAKETSTEWQG